MSKQFKDKLLFYFNLLQLIKLSLSQFVNTDGFYQNEEERYINTFDTLIKDSYSSQLSQDLISQCKTQFKINNPQQISIQSSMNSINLQQYCGTSSICMIPAGLTVTMISNLNVAALVVQGTLEWNDNTQIANYQFLCAGYIAINGGFFNVNLSSKKGYIYLKNNGLKNTEIKTRALGSYNKGKINIKGRYLSRTWSLLAQKAINGMGSISLMHNPQDMGWMPGDRIVIAPTETGSRGDAEEFIIGGFGSDNSIKLKDKNGINQAVISKLFKFDLKYTGDDMHALITPEVINLSRNIIITGDDFEHVTCQNDIAGWGPPPDTVNSDHCSCWPGINRTKCTLGLHTISIGEGSVLSIQYTRIEKCGQRGIMGKYCTHFHLNKNCSDCKIIGNAFEYGHQRGSAIHGTHLATVEYNVYNDIRGASIYIEDGNEMYNRINYNVGICPWKKWGIKGGCTIPGTNNGQADTSDNQAGLWALSFTNYVIGNRFANNFNGMLYQEQSFGGVKGGRGHVFGLECLSYQQMGRLEGNTFHGCGRFGTYVLADVFPKNTGRTLARNGLPVLESCSAWTSTGEDNGLPATFMNNIDYDNAFVGQYGSGDLQYRFHTSIQNANLIYWKFTKNFQDGCSAHIADSYYEQGNLALPGGHGTFVLENIIFSKKVYFISSHHCNVGITGILCMPTYLFINITWTETLSSSTSIMSWGPNNGAMFTLGPDDQNNTKGNFLFPAGFTSIVNPYWSYLEAIDSGTSCYNTYKAASILNVPASELLKKYDNKGAIFCKRPVRRLEVFSFGQTNNKNQNMRLELWQNGKMVSSTILKYFQIGDTRKQGYSTTIIPGLTHQYRLSMENGGNVPSDWIIEFSDPIFGNRWTRDEIDLVVIGRTCPYPVHSQHDRRYIWSGEEYLNVKGRGACTSFPDMKSISCKTQLKLTNVENCPNLCQNKCYNGFCDCGTGKCMCNPGFSGLNCTIDTCAAAKCVNGNCASRYLGGYLLVTKNPCVCKDGWYGPKCDTVIKPTDPVIEPVCIDGYFTYLDTDIQGENMAVITNTKDCSNACNINSTCNSWVFAFGNCYLKTSTQKISKNGVTSGIKCLTAVITDKPTTVTISTATTNNPITETVCMEGYLLYPDTDIVGTDMVVIPSVSSPKQCSNACDSNDACNSWVYGYNMCYLKNSTQKVSKYGITSGIKCSSNTVCSDGYFVYPNTDIVGTDMAVITSPSTSKDCSNSCNSNSACNSWVFGYNMCYLKTGIQQIAKIGIISGIKCSISQTSIKPSSVTSTVSSTQSILSCNGRCKGDYPYGCNLAFSLGYCNSVGGCHYSSLTDPNNWCCFKGC